MSRAYHRQDALQIMLLKRSEKQRLSSADKCQQIILERNSVIDLRKEIPGQLDITRKEEECSQQK